MKRENVWKKCLCPICGKHHKEPHFPNRNRATWWSEVVVNATGKEMS